MKKFNAKKEFEILKKEVNMNTTFRGDNYGTHLAIDHPYLFLVVTVAMLWLLIFVIILPIINSRDSGDSETEKAGRFIITKEECVNKTIEVIGNNYGDVGTWIYYFNPPANAIHCMVVEFDGWIWNEGGVFGIDSDNLTIEWLEENCECLKMEEKCSWIGRAMLSEDKKYCCNSVVGCKKLPCFKYKCGDYLVEVK